MTDTAVQQLVSREGLRTESPDSVNDSFAKRWMHREFSWSFRVRPETIATVDHYLAWQKDRIYQDLNNNLWDNNPGELERWADDGGAVW